MAFWILNSLVSKYEFKGYLTEEMPQLKVSLYQLERLIQIHLPNICNTLKEKKISTE